MERKKILVVEDDEASHFIFGAVLEHTGYEVIQAWGAEEALRLVRQHLPDLIVMDVGLPQVSGLEITREIKADPALSSIPVVVVTVHVFEQDRQAAYAAGCDHFLEKPLEPRILVQEVMRILGPPAVPSSS